MHYITGLDYILLPFYLGIIYWIAYTFRNKKYPKGHPWRPYFIPGLTAKIIGAIFIGLVYQYYYGYGDTFVFYGQALVINSASKESLVKGVNLMLHIPKWYEGSYFNYIYLLSWYDISSNYIVCVITAFLNTFTFNTYLVTSVLFGSIAYTGFWALFRTFAAEYPRLTKQVAIATLFIPTTIVWGSGIFKDTICMCGLGWITFTIFQMLIKRNFSIPNIFLFLLCFFLLQVTKIYILLALLPAAAIWIFFIYNSKIKNALARYAINIFTMAAVVLTGVFFSGELKDQLGTYAIDKLSETASITRGNIVHDSGEEGSAYDIGDFDPTVSGLLLQGPAAVNVTLFRPYLWESKNPLMVFNALEALVFFLCTLRVLFLVGIIKIVKLVKGDPNVQFFLLFTLVFAFFVGISTGNFGTLSRYKIPCIPFFMLSLMILFYKKYDPEKKRLFWIF